MATLAVSTVSLTSPAKINLFLAVTGKRVDGFHDLVSLAVPVEFGDRLSAGLTASPGLVLECDDPTLATDESNLVIRAAKAFRREVSFEGGVRFVLQKRIPQGAGLGGGSSNAASALQALNRLTGMPLSSARLSTLAAEIGSDCALFLDGGAVVMRGRGERIEPLEEGARDRLSGRRVWIIKPSVGVSTPWAYRMLAAEAPRLYLSAVEAEQRLVAWVKTPSAPLSALLYNSFEAVVFRKFVALPLLLKRLADLFGLQTAMSGSGNACYAFSSDSTEDPGQTAEIVKVVREAWGNEAFVVETRLRSRALQPEPGDLHRNPR